MLRLKKHIELWFTACFPPPPPFFRVTHRRNVALPPGLGVVATGEKGLGFKAGLCDLAVLVKTVFWDPMLVGG